MSEDEFKVPAKSPQTSTKKPKESDKKPKDSGKGGRNPSKGGSKAARAAATKAKASKEAAASRKAARGKSSSKNKSPEGKLEAARVKGSSRLRDQKLPDVPDMGNLTPGERMGRVMGKKPQAGKKDEKKKEEPKSSRHAAIRSGLEKNAPSRPKAEPEVHVEKTPDGTQKLFKLVLVFLVALLAVLLVALVVKRSSFRSAENPATIAVIPAATGETSIPSGGEVESTISPGLGARAVSELFSGVAEPSELLSALEAGGLSGSIQPGTYSFAPGTDASSIAAAITARPAATSLTIWPGMTISEIDALLSNKGLCAPGEFTSAAEEAALGAGLSFAEGWLLAGNYSFTSASSLVKEMLSSTLSLFKGNASLLSASGLSMEQAVVIASMVNRETQDPSQMPVIAKIILNRLEEGMPLGIDATTRYELDDWTNPVPQSVYERDTPYNTRRRPGLPPSGIGCPGREAALAVLAPDGTTDLYYLHDPDGGLHTSATYEEHLETYERVH